MHRREVIKSYIRMRALTWKRRKVLVRSAVASRAAAVHRSQVFHLRRGNIFTTTGRFCVARDEAWNRNSVGSSLTGSPRIARARSLFTPTRLAVAAHYRGGNSSISESFPIRERGDDSLLPRGSPAISRARQRIAVANCAMDPRREDSEKSTRRKTFVRVATA